MVHIELRGLLVTLTFLQSFPFDLAHLSYLSLLEECSPELG